MRRLLILLLLLGLAASACGTADPPAATVDGSDISSDELLGDLEVLRENPDFSRLFFGFEPNEPSPGTVDSSSSMQLLSIYIRIQVARNEFADRGLEVTEEDRQAFTDLMQSEIGSPFLVLPVDYRSRLIDWNSEIDVLNVALVDEARGEGILDGDVREFYDRNPERFDLNCASHILVETEDEALQILDELANGASFSDLADERTTDPSGQGTGGDLGCSGRGRYLAPFEEVVYSAAIGEPTGPVVTQFGFHVVLVRDRRVQPFEEVEEQIRVELEAAYQQALNSTLRDFVTEQLVDADVDLDPRFGRWDAEQQQVVPLG